MQVISRLQKIVGRRFVSGGAWAIAGKLLSSTTNVLVIGLLARMLSAKEMGAYFLLFSFAAAGAVTAQLGLDQSVIRLIASSMGTGMAGQARAAAQSVLLWGTLGALTVGGILAVGTGRLLADLLFHSPLVSGAMLFVAVWVVIAALQNLLAETFRGFHNIALASLFSRGLSNVIYALLLSGLWLWRHHADLRQAVGVSLMAGAATVVIAGVTLFRKLRGLGPAVAIDSRQMLVAALPQLVTNLTLIVNSQAALWILGASRPAEDTAIYGAAVRLVVLVNLPIVLANSVVAPIIAELYAQRQKKELEASLRNIATLAGIPAVLGLIIYFAFGKFVLGLAFGSFYQQGAVVLAVLGIGQLANVWSGSCGLTLVMSGHQKTMMNITLACGAFNAVAALLLVRVYGAVGAAEASAATMILQNVLMLIYVKRKAGVWTHARFSLVGKYVFAR